MHAKTPKAWSGSRPPVRDSRSHCPRPRRPQELCGCGRRLIGFARLNASSEAFAHATMLTDEELGCCTSSLNPDNHGLHAQTSRKVSTLQVRGLQAKMCEWAKSVLYAVGTIEFWLRQSKMALLSTTMFE